MLYKFSVVVVVGNVGFVENLLQSMNFRFFRCFSAVFSMKIAESFMQSDFFTEAALYFFCGQPLESAYAFSMVPLDFECIFRQKQRFLCKTECLSDVCGIFLFSNGLSIVVFLLPEAVDRPYFCR